MANLSLFLLQVVDFRGFCIICRLFSYLIDRFRVYLNGIRFVGQSSFINEKKKKTYFNADPDSPVTNAMRI